MNPSANKVSKVVLATFGIFVAIDWVPYAAIKNPVFGDDAPSHLILDHEMAYAVSATLTVPLS